MIFIVGPNAISFQLVETTNLLFERFKSRSKNYPNELGMLLLPNVLDATVLLFYFLDFCTFKILYH